MGALWLSAACRARLPPAHPQRPVVFLRRGLFARHVVLTLNRKTQGGEDGFLSLREALPEQFDRAAIEAVLAEWFKTLADLPAGLRMAVEMVRNAFSSSYGRRASHIPSLRVL